MLTNARSLSPKINSLHTMFEEHDLDIALITESWLKDGSVLDRDVIDLEYGTDLKILYKNRPKRPTSARSVGGGVSIIYKKNRCSFKERRLSRNNFEIVSATGKCAGIARSIAIFCLYVEPRMKVGELEELNDLISNEVLQLKASLHDPLILFGGDLNRRDLSPATADFDDIVRINSEPTRGDACLDVLYSNARIASHAVWPPLETNAGVKSDHNCVVFNIEQEKPRAFTWKRKTVRKFSEKAAAAFGNEMRNVNWSQVMAPGASPDALLETFETITQESINRLFPMKSVRYRSNEAPWITNGARRLANLKKRVYKRESKSPLWHTLDGKLQELIERSKASFVAKAKKAGPQSRTFFEAVKVFSTHSSATPWAVDELFPDTPPEEVGDKVASYFTGISNTFNPLPDWDGVLGPDEQRRPLDQDTVAKFLKAAKNLNSSVDGDILPALMRRFHALFAEPTTNIFNSVFSTGRWPAKWKVETTVVIPKTAKPSSLSECRNISCTSFLSKVLESVLLKDLQDEIPIDPTQYGGIKGCSTNHLLVDLIDNVLAPMEEGHPSIICSIDYQKAFNRLDHAECLRQLERLGASRPSLALIRAFLTGRQMRTRIGQRLSSLHNLNGGSPQGSILGCRLYCLTTQQINSELPRPTTINSPPSGGPRPQPQPSAMEEQRSPEPPGMGLMPHDLSDSTSSPSTPPPTPNWGDQSTAVDDFLGRLVEAFKYVDDTTLVGLVNKLSTLKHFTTNRTLETANCPELDALLAAIITRTEEIGMKVNASKTQIICVSPDNGCHTTAAVSVGGNIIESTDRMKLLGFMLSSDPNMNKHVEFIQQKFRGRFWALIHLKRAGMTGLDLFRMYTVFVRPIIETNSVIYHSMLTRHQCNTIEKMQRKVIRLCFGFNMHPNVFSEMYDLKTLEERRELSAKKFVQKALQTPRFANKWFLARPEVETNLRRRNKYVEKQARTSRYYNSPLLYLQRVANSLA